MPYRRASKALQWLRGRRSSAAPRWARPRPESDIRAPSQEVAASLAAARPEPPPGPVRELRVDRRFGPRSSLPRRAGRSEPTHRGHRPSRARRAHRRVRRHLSTPAPHPPEARARRPRLDARQSCGRRDPTPGTHWLDARKARPARNSRSSRSVGSNSSPRCCEPTARGPSGVGAAVQQVGVVGEEVTQ